MIVAKAGVVLSGDTLALVAVCAIAAAVGLILIRMIKGITFFSINTDDEVQVRAAARAGEWRWVSDMHKNSGDKTRMKDAVVVLLAGMQRLLHDRTSDYPLVVLCIMANSASAILVFLIASTFWTTGVALLVFALFITCLWHYQIALFGGHICTAQMFFLISVYLMQRAGLSVPFYELMWYFTSGATIGLMMFSSASARKYLPLLIGAFIYNQRQALSTVWPTSGWEGFLFGDVEIAIICLAAVLMFSLVFIRLNYRRIVTAIYFEQAPHWLNRIVKERKKIKLEYYIELSDELTHFLTRLTYVSIIWLIVSLAIARSHSFYWSQLALLAGVAAVSLLFTYPDVAANLAGYYRYWHAGNRSGHFPSYREYFASIGKPIRDDMRGAGLGWIPRFLGRMVPFHAALYVVYLFLLILLTVTGNDLIKVGEAAVIITLSLSPILIGEITRGIQLGRSYYPGLAGMLLLIAYTAFQAAQWLPLQARLVFWIASAAVVLAGAGWSLWVFLSDIWPARMAPAWLGRKLRTLVVKEFYTYNTPYNDAFMKALPREVLGEYNIHFIETLNQVKEGYVVVPGTSSKALNMESQPLAIKHGDFDLDQELNHLIESKEIEQCAVASFKTFGTSRIWVHESEVSSYRDLILRQIGANDRWRGRAWILDAGKVAARR